MEIIFPWNADSENPRHVWAKGCLSLRNYRDSVRNIPSDKKIEQIKSIVQCANRKEKRKNWCFCFSESQIYMRELYPYIAAAWIYTKRQPADIMEISDLIGILFTKDEEQKIKKIEHIINTGLLIIPNIGNAIVSNKNLQNQLYSLLAQRKVKRKPVITDSVDVVGVRGALKSIKVIIETLGQSGMDLFTTATSTYIRVMNR